MVVSVFSETADLLEFYHTALSRVYRERCEKEKLSSERYLRRATVTGKKTLVKTKVCGTESLSGRHCEI